MQSEIERRRERQQWRGDAIDHSFQRRPDRRNEISSRRADGHFGAMQHWRLGLETRERLILVNPRAIADARALLTMAPGRSSASLVGGEPQHLQIAAVHFHASGVRSHQDRVQPRQIVAGHIEQQVMLEVVIDEIGRDELRSMRFASVVRVLRKGRRIGTTACSAMLRMRVMTIIQVSSGTSHSSG